MVWQKKIGALYSGLNLKSKANAIIFTEWFIIRRVAYSATALFAQSQTWLQFQILFNLSIVTIWLMGYVRPFETRNFLIMEFINEIFLCIVLYHMICFTDIVSDSRARTDAGVSCVAFTSIVLIINFCVLFSGILHRFKLIIQRYQNRKRYQKLLNFRRLQDVSLLEQQVNNRTDLGDLERKIIAVEVKAKKTSYLSNLTAGSGRSRI